MQVKSFSDYLVEDAKKEVTFVFGRFNPPTIGHEKLFDQTKKLARSGTYRIHYNLKTKLNFYVRCFLNMLAKLWLIRM